MKWIDKLRINQNYGTCDNVTIDTLLNTTHTNNSELKLHVYKASAHREGSAAYIQYGGLQVFTSLTHLTGSLELL